MCEDTFSRATGGHLWTWNFYDANEKPRRVQQYRVVNDTVGGVAQTHDYWYDALGRRVLAHTYADTLGCGDPPTTSPHPEACQQSLTRAAWDGDFLLWESRRPAAWNLSPATLDVSPSNDAWYGQRRNMQAGAIDVPLLVWNGSGVGLSIIRNWRGNAAGEIQISGTTLGYEPVWPAAQVDIRHAPDARTSPPQTNSWWGSLVSDQADATGLLYRRNRYYDPQTGRFTQEDPIGLAGGLNLYGYGDGDPVNSGDPFGLCPDCLFDVAMIVAGIADIKKNGLGIGNGLALAIDVVAAVVPMVPAVAGAGMRNARVAAAVRRGNQAHDAYFAEKTAEGGWNVNKTLGKERLRPDAWKRDGNHIIVEDLKPNTESGRRAAAASARKYERAAAQQCPECTYEFRAKYYDP
ncbi:MAG: RHS repeat-associated core domain-containing protein [Gemmatimonadaceae bacterium]|nr:RHS repeat-associated core domain-containing protein [Gemmatimonadaceae bacterium]